MKHAKRTLILICVILSNIVLCGAKSKSVEIDTKNNKLYKLYSVDEVIADKAEDNFGLCAIVGVITNVSDNDKKAYLKDDLTGETIMLDTSKIKSKMQDLDLSHTYKVLGTANSDKFGKSAHIEVESIEQSTKKYVAGDSTYCLINGKDFNKSDMSGCTLNNGNIKYYIPNYWKADGVEVNIKENGIGYVDGYQYVLNKTPGSNENIPESFFVCYFEYDGNLTKDSNVSKPKPIEKAIVNNIDDKMIIKPIDVSAYYGPKYHYYQGKYDDPIQVNDTYHTEYIFEPVGEEGLIMYLYVYDKATHKDDILYVTRFLEKTR